MESIRAFFQGKKAYIAIAGGLLTIWLGYFTGVDADGNTVIVSLSAALTSSAVLIAQLFQKIGDNRVEKKIDAVISGTK